MDAKDLDKALENIPPEMHEPIHKVLSTKGLSVQQVVSRFFRIVIDHQIQGELDHRGFLLHSILYDSDRGSVLISASLMDNKLEDILTSHFKSKSKISDKEISQLFSGPLAPIQSTSVKIKLAFALGLIDGHIKASLSALQRIRSTQAAHTYEPFVITKEMCQEIINELPPDSRKDLEKKLVEEEVLVNVIFNMISGEGPLSKTKLIFLRLMQTLMDLLSISHA